MRKKTIHTIEIEYVDEPVTSFGGMILLEKMAQRLGMWSSISKLFSKRRGEFSWTEMLKSIIMGLHTGAKGTAATTKLRKDKAVLAMLELKKAPEEATVWRSFEALGKFQSDGVVPQMQADIARRALEKMKRNDLELEGYIPVFCDGTLLEGSSRREGTKYIKDKGNGLMLSTIFVSRVLSGISLAPEGRGEHSEIRAMIPLVKKEVLEPLKMDKKTLMLMDSLHGDDTVLSLLEKEELHYVVGANKLDLTENILREQPASQWESLGTRPTLNWSEWEVCECWIQCENWEKKRLLVGCRWKKEGEMIWNYSGVMTDLRENDLSKMTSRGLSFAKSVWSLYDAKSGMETLFSDGLSDLGLHNPPCQKHIGNSGFYAAAGLAWVLGTATDAIGGESEERGSIVRKDGAPRKKPKPKRTRFWKLRQDLFTNPGRIIRHGRKMVVQLIGLDETSRALFDRYWNNICRC